MQKLVLRESFDQDRCQCHTGVTLELHWRNCVICLWFLWRKHGKNILLVWISCGDSMESDNFNGDFMVKLV